MRGRAGSSILLCSLGAKADWAPSALSAVITQGRVETGFPKNQGGRRWLQGQEGSKFVRWECRAGVCEGLHLRGLCGVHGPPFPHPGRDKGEQSPGKSPGPGRNRKGVLRCPNLFTTFAGLLRTPQATPPASSPSKQTSRLGTLASSPHTARPLCVQVGSRVHMGAQLSVCLTQGHL